jgi:hypothetical protein
MVGTGGYHHLKPDDHVGPGRMLMGPSFLLQEKVNVSADYWKCVRQVLFCHFCFELPMIFFFHPMGHLFGMKITEVPFPTW